MATDEFEPRRADPDQTFGYTGSDTKKLPLGDDLTEEQEIEGWAITGFDPETGDREITRSGVQKTFKSDADGIVRPTSIEEVRVLDAYQLPVARSVQKAEKTPEASGKKEG
jgi:hypothetical protein